MGDEDYQGPKASGDRSGQLRPSMVVMTSKLLDVSEGIASMNLKIAAGVFLCVVLLIATFIVNILAFEYAKDNKVSNGKLVDKESGEIVFTATEFAPAEPLVVLDSVYLAAMKERHVVVGTDVFFVTFTDKAIVNCPTSVSAEHVEALCEGGVAYLAFSHIGVTVALTQGDGEVEERYAPKEFVDAALEEGIEQRKLLHDDDLPHRASCITTADCGRGQNNPCSYPDMQCVQVPGGTHFPTATPTPPTTYPTASPTPPTTYPTASPTPPTPSPTPSPTPPTFGTGGDFAEGGHYGGWGG